MAEERIPKNWRDEYLNVERSNLQLQKDLTIAFDRIDELKRKYNRALIVNATLTAMITALAFKGLELVLQSIP